VTWCDGVIWKVNPINQTKQALKWSFLLIKEIATKLMGDGGTSDPKASHSGRVMDNKYTAT
jgi:hypothetical protein